MTKQQFFNQKEQMKSFVDKLTKEDLIEFYHYMFKEHSGKLSI
jgi:hypothetical protein